MSDWKPIKTAPRDGTRVIVTCAGVDMTYIAAWRLPRMGEPQFYGHHRYEWRDDAGRWAAPTHWQPLPEPPEVSDE